MLRRAIAIAVLAIATAGLGAQTALASDEPRVPEEVASYFATGLVPRLADLYGSGSFDATTKVGVVRRVLAFTKAFRSGGDSTTPTELTNNWVAPVSTKDDVVLGLATVWINPGSDLPELANFAPGTATVAALAAAPAGALLVRDDPTGAWFASDGTTITPLVRGTSGVTSALPNAQFRKKLVVDTPAPANEPNQGLLVAGIVLGIVVVLLAGFVMLPDRRRARVGSADDDGAAKLSDADSPAGSAVPAEHTAEPPVEDRAAEPAAAPAAEPAAAPATGSSPAPQAPQKRPPAKPRAASAKPRASSPRVTAGSSSSMPGSRTSPIARDPSSAAVAPDSGVEGTD